MKANGARAFAFRLALAMHNPYVTKGMSAKTFAQWMWYEQVEPFGELRADYRTAQIVEMLHNTAVAQENQKSIDAFLLKFVPKPPKQTTADMWRMIKMFCGVP